jgi:hypothetical protein
MKKNLLLLFFAISYTFAQAQIVVYVQAPSPLEGSYAFTYTDVAGGDWSSPDLLDPANAVLAEMAMAYDGSATADSLICDPPVISDVDGKVAVLFRGACEFGAKALACQEAGAVAVMIITYEGEVPVEMGGGASGLDVTIPVVMITRAAGVNLRPEIEAGGTFVFIGNKVGYYENDLGLKNKDVVRAQFASNVQLLSQDETEFDVQVGAWVTNFGSNDQTGVTLTANIDLAGDNLYNETSDPVDILSGDSAYFALPTFSQADYPLGMYEMSYSTTSAAVDDFPSDNLFLADFRMSESTFSYAQVPDEATGPLNAQFTSAGTPLGELQTCIVFQDPNASRVTPLGMTFACSTFGEGLDGEVVSIYAYEWTLQFEDLNDPAFSDVGIVETDLDLLSSAVYEYVGDDMSDLNIYLPFEDPIDLDDDARYFFCLAFDSEVVRNGYDISKVDYAATQDVYLQAMYPNTDGQDWFTNGFGTDMVPGLSVNMVDVNAIGINEADVASDITPYPNPAQDFIQIPLKDVSGLTTIQVFDVSGKLVETLSVSVTPGEILKFNVSNLDRGVYTFGLRYENGNVSNFNVVISK